MVTAKEAVSLGMADRVGTLEDTIARLLKAKSTSGRRAEEDGDEVTLKDDGDEVMLKLDAAKDGTVSVTFHNMAKASTTTHNPPEAEDSSIEPDDTKEEEAEEVEAVEVVEESAENISEDEDDLYQWQTKIERWKQNALDKQESSS